MVKKKQGTIFIFNPLSPFQFNTVVNNYHILPLLIQDDW